MTTVDQLEARLAAAEAKADRAAEVALAAVATHRSLQIALEKGHEQMGEMLAATRQMAALTESLARHVLGGNAPLPRTKTPSPVLP